MHSKTVFFFKENLIKFLEYLFLVCFGLGISPIVGNLTLDPLYTYILNIYD